MYFDDIFSDNKSNYSFSSNKTSFFDENVVNFKIGAVREEKLSVRSDDNEDKDYLKTPNIKRFTKTTIWEVPHSIYSIKTSYKR